MSPVIDGAGRSDFSAHGVEITGIKNLLRDAEAIGLAVEDLTELTYSLAEPIAQLARQLAPRGDTGKLAAGIKPSKSKRAVRVRVGSAQRLPYAGVNHWGIDSRSGPKWLSTAEERLRNQTFEGFGKGISELLEKHHW